MNSEVPHSYQYQPQDILPEPPKRVVSLVPSMTETLFDLGFGQYVVGITDDCLFPAATLQQQYRVGPMDAVRVDDIRGLFPDLIIANPEENGPAAIDQLEASGLKVWKIFPRTVTEAMNLIWDALHLFMVDDRMLYERVNLINRTIDWVGSAAEAQAEVYTCKVFVPLLKNPLTTFGPDTYAHDLLRTSGGYNVFADKILPPLSDHPAKDLNRYPIITLDEVLARKPEIILLPSYPLPFDEHDLSKFQALDVPAAKDGEIYLIDGSLLTYYGTRLARALNEISALMCTLDETI